MIESLKARLAVCALVAILGVIWFAPNVINTDKVWWPTKEKLVYGLDLQGGLHLVLGVDTPAALKEQSHRVAAAVKEGLKQDQNMDVTTEVLNPERVQFKITYPAISQKQVETYLDTYHRGDIQIVKNEPGNMEVEYYDSYLIHFKKNLIEKARQVIANRIDEFGVAEPNITVQGTERILVQLPGVKDTESAKNLINRTAKLEFMIVDTTVKMEDLQSWIDQAEKEGQFALGKNDLRYTAYIEKLNAAIKSKLPKNTVVRFIKSPNAKNLESGKLPYLLHTDEMVGGDKLEDAYTTFNGQTNLPQVAFRFSDASAREFADLTTKHTKEFMAIVLDGVVQSAPIINSPITTGSGVIEMNNRDYQTTLNEANLLSMVLRSGALPVSLQQLEERTVGPSLGKDSIEKGKLATLIGSSLVILFMFFYYRVFGLVANIAIVLNIVLLFAVLSSLRATLTLPGIAGIALTVGMAVDANILIFERIRDELRKGASLLASVREGFDRAFWTIFDANVTTVGTCFVLMYYGTGPIRGFAISLIIGLVISMFTAVFLSRALIDFFTIKLKWNLKL